MADEPKNLNLATSNENVAARDRMLFEIYIADIREAKAREWHITYLVFLLFGAIVAAGRLLPGYSDCWLFSAALFSGGTAIFVLWSSHSTIARRRREIEGPSTKLWRDWWLPTILTVYIVGGTSAAISLISLPDVSPAS